MAVMTSGLQKALMDQVLGATAYTPPATVYVGLATNTAAPSADGHDLTEVSGGGYVRFALTNNTTNFPAGVADANGYHKFNGIQVNFPTSSTTTTFSAAAGTATYWFMASDNLVVNSTTGANIMFFGALGTSQVLSQGSTADFPAGSAGTPNAGIEITLN